MHKKCLMIIGITMTIFAAQAADTAVPADNTAINQRDRSSQTLTPQNQPESKGEVELAAKVRRAVIAQSGLSIAGQNIKIIAEGNRVTLRGPVKDAAERGTIETAARQAAGSATVDDQLEVK